MEEYPHKFTSKLKGQKVIEHDRCEFEIDVEADDAEVCIMYWLLVCLEYDESYFNFRWLGIITEWRSSQMTKECSLCPRGRRGSWSLRTHCWRTLGKLRSGQMQTSRQQISKLHVSRRKEEISVRVILVTEILESENLDPENPVLGNFRPRNASAWKGQCKEISEQGNPSAR